MAGVVRPAASMAMKPLATFSVSAASRQLVQQRAFASVSRNALSAARNQRQSLVQQSRRGYADQSPSASLAPKPKKRAGILRWLWRLTKVGAVGMLGFTAYGIYVNRNPIEQQEPDPSKKTLVVLGGCFAIAIV